MITHNEVTFLLWLLVAASSGTVGLLIGRGWPTRKRLREEREAAWDRGVDWGLDHCGHGGVTGVFVCSLFRGHPGDHEDRAETGTVSWPRDDVPRSEPVQELRKPVSAGPGRTYEELTPLGLALSDLEEGELPEPPMNIARWWAAEMDALIYNGQSDWYTEMAGL